MPREGGLDDQDAQWVADIDFMRVVEYQVGKDYETYRHKNGLDANDQ